MALMDNTLNTNALEIERIAARIAQAGRREQPAVQAKDCTCPDLCQVDHGN